MKTLASLLGLTLTWPIMAASLKAPVDLPSAKVLPEGVRNVRIKGVSFEANDKYDTTGESIPVGDALNKSVTWKTLVDAKDTVMLVAGSWPPAKWT